MPRDNPPPLTSRQAKRLHAKRGKKFEFTPSQYRAAERRSELEERRKEAVAKEQRRKESKRKRGEKEERDRDLKRRQLAEGRITVEDTWGKVGSSQPRLVAFFKKPESPSVEKSENVPHNEDSDRGNGKDFVEEKIEPVNKPTLAAPAEKAPTDVVLNFFQSFCALSISDLFSQQPTMEANTAQGHESTQRTEPLAPPSQPGDPDQGLLDAQLSFSQSFWDFVIAEDETAGLEAENTIINAEERSLTPGCPNKPCIPQTGDEVTKASPLKRKAADSHHSSFCSPSKSMRSVLSEMTRSDVNVRAQEKPDITSTPKPELTLPSPKQEQKAETPADVLALISTQDLEDDPDGPPHEKENQDPWLPDPKEARIRLDQDKTKPTTTTQSQQQLNSRPREDLDSFEDYEDLFDLNFETHTADDFDEDGVDDSTLAGMSTQIPAAKNTRVNDHGSPTKAKATSHTASTKPIPFPKPHMAPPTLPKQASATAQDLPKPIQRSKSGLTKSNSYSFDCLEDEALMELAEQIEAETTRRTSNKGRRRIPWLHERSSQLSDDGTADLEADELLTPSPEIGED